jgi:hypothetical protein
MALLKKN